MNIYDIAAMSGVSIATVSRVVNGSRKVSETTRQKVLSVIEANGYTPNVFAQGLGLHTMHTIGILVPDIADPYMSSAVSYLEGQLKGYGYDCILSCSGFEQVSKEARVQMLLSKHIDALILVGSTYTGHGRSERETQYIRDAAQQVPVFVINGVVSGQNIYSSVSCDRQAVCEAVGALLRTGRKRILFLTDSKSYSAREKRAGYEEAYRAAGLAVPRSLMQHVLDSIQGVRDFLLHSRLAFDAVVATDDSMAVGAIKYAVLRRISIPKDLAVIGYNNSALACCSEPELSSIDNRSRQLCQETVDRLIDVLSGNTSVPQHLCVPCCLVQRATTDFKPPVQQQPR